ncbi:MAG: DUF2585 family protein [Candidatus Binataceae bacterium]
MVAAALIGLAAAAEFAMGRKLWGLSGEPGIWSGNIESSHNSQFMFDPYTFSHVTHGVLWYGLLSLIAKRLPVGARFVAAVALECAWEVFENTDLVIQRYRAATISLNYYGDSVNPKREPDFKRDHRDERHARGQYRGQHESYQGGPNIAHRVHKARRARWLKRQRGVIYRR